MKIILQQHHNLIEYHYDQSWFVEYHKNANYQNKNIRKLPGLKSEWKNY